jgi:hypothetical protein
LSTGILDEWLEVAMENAGSEFTNHNDIRIISLSILV